MTNKFSPLAAPNFGSGDLGLSGGDSVIDQAGINAWSKELDWRAAEQFGKSVNGDGVGVPHNSNEV